MDPIAAVHQVLLVDDEPDIRAVAELALEMVAGWNVTTAMCGEEALLRVHEEPRPDLILLDVMMPGMDGPQTLEQLLASEETASIPVIFMTAKVLPGEVGSYVEAGARGVIAKPFDPMTLPQEIKVILEGDGAGAPVR